MNPPEPCHYLVTGGAGFIGSALVPRLLLHGNWVTVIDRLFYGAEGCLAHLGHPRFKLLAMDVCDSEASRAVFERNAEIGVPKIEAVIHLAAAVGHQVCQALGPEETIRINVTGAEAMYRLAQHLAARKYIFASTCSVYGRTQSKELDEDGELNPVSAYGRSKVEAESTLLHLAADSPCGLLIFRLASVFGLSPRMRFDVLVNQLVRQAHLERKLLLHHPNHWRPLVHIQDAVDALLIGLDGGASDDGSMIINLGSEKNCLTKKAMADEIKDSMSGVTIEHSNASLSPPDQDVRLRFSRLKTKLGFQAARSLSHGIEELSAALRQGWFVNQPGRYRNLLSIPLTSAEGKSVKGSGSYER